MIKVTYSKLKYELSLYSSTRMISLLSGLVDFLETEFNYKLMLHQVSDQPRSPVTYLILPIAPKPVQLKLLLHQYNIVTHHCSPTELSSFYLKTLVILRFELNIILRTLKISIEN